MQPTDRDAVAVAAAEALAAGSGARSHPYDLRTVKRLPSALACLVALVVSMVGLSGCNVQFSPYAAVVNGSEISQSQLHEALSAIAADAGYVCTIEAGGTSRVVGAGDGTFNSSFSAEVLSILIQDEVVRQEIVRLGLSEPATLGPVAQAQLAAATSPSNVCVATGASIIDGIAPQYRRQVIRFQVDEDVLAARLADARLTPAGLLAFESSHRDQTTLACISAIIVGTRTEAALLRLQLLRGASFASLGSGALDRHFHRRPGRNHRLSARLRVQASP